MSAASFDVPDFDKLPKVEGQPQGCVWGVFDKDGRKDLLGAVNLLTPDVVKAAAAEVKEGVSVSLNWLMGSNKILPPGRKNLVHKHATLEELGMHGHGWDDEVSFNTQCSSQWDSLCHFAHQSTRLSYNGATPTHEALAAASSTADNTLPTLDHWHERGGLVGRGVLIDYKEYAEQKGIPFTPYDGKQISAQEIEDVAKHQGVEFKRGDILILHTGFTELLDGAKSLDELLPFLGQMKISGAEASEEFAKWAWNKHFAAVAGDSPAFEVILPHPDGPQKGIKELVLHQWFLSMFGLPIGELWDLKALSAQCKKSGKYSFMLTSAPLNVTCLIGSPPNALAIF